MKHIRRIKRIRGQKAKKVKRVRGINAKVKKKGPLYIHLKNVSSDTESVIYKVVNKCNRIHNANNRRK